MLSASYFILLSFTVSFCNTKFLFAMNADVSLVKIKTKADSNEITFIAECSHDDKPSTGMFAVSDDIVSAVSCLCIFTILCAVCCLRCFDCYCSHVITCCVAKIRVY